LWNGVVGACVGEIGLFSFIVWDAFFVFVVVVAVVVVVVYSLKLEIYSIKCLLN
jgi:hypothetical protein